MLVLPRWASVAKTRCWLMRLGSQTRQRSRVNEADACASSIAALQVGKPRNQHRWNESHKARITDQMRKFAAQMNLDMFGVIGFKGARMRLVKVNENAHHLAWVQLAP